jgi:hypothetical protein
MFDHVVWINLKDYTPLEFFFYGLGCFLWVIAYAIYIRNIPKLKYVEMPVFAGCCDVGWEFTWSFFAFNNMGMLFQAANWVWFALDIGFIFTLGVLRYGAKQLTTPVLQRRSIFVPACVLIAAFSALATYEMYAQNLDNAVGGRSAYLIQLTISFLYIPLMLRQKDLSCFSYAASWCRSLGSALVVVFFFLHYPDDRFLQTIGTTAAIVDSCYLYLFAKKRQALAGNTATSPEWQGALGLSGGPVSPSLP